MQTRQLIATAVLALASALAAATEAPATWDGLVEVRSKSLDTAYVAPGADFRPYTRLMVDPTEAAFRKDWLKNVNDRTGVSGRVSADDARRILENAQQNFADVFHEAFGKAGYAIVTEPGPDVLRVSPGVINLYVNASDTLSAGRSRSYTTNAGEATMVLELRDSQTNALLGRAIDRRETRDSMGMQRASSVTNSADFRLLFQSWAKVCVKGLAALKAASPLPDPLTPGQKIN